MTGPLHDRRLSGPLSLPLRSFVLYWGSTGVPGDQYCNIILQKEVDRRGKDKREKGRVRGKVQWKEKNRRTRGRLSCLSCNFWLSYFHTTTSVPKGGSGTGSADSNGFRFHITRREFIFEEGTKTEIGSDSSSPEYCQIRKHKTINPSINSKLLDHK